MNPMVKRIVVSIFPVFLTFYGVIFSPIWFYILVIEVIVLFGLNEYVDMVEKKGIEVSRPLILCFGALLPLFEFWSSGFMILMIACLFLFIFDFRRKMRKQALVSTSLAVFGIVYVSWFFSHLVRIKMLPHGTAWAMYVLILVKTGDAAAYFIGVRYGKTKLIEHISPNKSVEGALGGLAVTVLFSLLSKIYLSYVPMFHLMVLGILVGIVAQLGDLVESYIKRDAGVKDSGRVPGLGGVLDVIDSLLLSIPFVYYYVHTFLTW